MAAVALLTQFPAFGSLNTVVMVLLVVFGIPAIIGGGVSAYRGLTLARDNEVALAVGESLRAHLDERYTFVRNVSRRRLGYIDAVLVGPPGALVFRIVDYSGTWRNEVAEWKIKDRNGRMRPAPTNPTRECARDVYALRQFLARQRLDKVPVYGVVVFHSRNLVLQGAGPVVPIAETHRLQEILRRSYLLEEERISRQQAEGTINALTGG
jgi:hypothetical protein